MRSTWATDRPTTLDDQSPPKVVTLECREVQGVLIGGQSVVRQIVMTMTGKEKPGPPGPDEFYADLSSRIAAGEADEALIERLDFLFDLLSVDPGLACDFADRALNVFSEHERHEPLGFALNLLVCALCSMGALSQVNEVLARAVEHAIETQSMVGAALALENAIGFLAESVTASEYLVPAVLTARRFFGEFPDPEKHVEFLASAARSFATFKAFPSAYRAAGDAERLAHEEKSTELLLTAWGAAFFVAMAEPDYEFAMKVGKRVLKVRKKVGLESPLNFRMNVALAAMNLGRTKFAIAEFEGALQDKEVSDSMRAALLVNLSACYRRAGKVKKSSAAMAEARRFGAKSSDPEQVIELELVAAANAKAGKDAPEVLRCVARAAQNLRGFLSLANRLHYRRGMREGYVRRIESLLLSVPPMGPAEEIVPIIAECRCGLVSDWLGLLRWVQGVEANSAVPSADKAALAQAIARIQNFGAPFLYGYREKYDDALDIPVWGTQPWDDFAAIQDRLRRHGVGEPYADASGDRLAELLSSKLAQGAWLFVAICPGLDHLVVLGGGTYRLVSLPQHSIREYLVELYRCATGEPDRLALAKRILEVRSQAGAALSESLDAACTAEATEYRYLPNALNAIPFNAIVLGHEASRERMKAGRIELWNSPVVFPRDNVEPQYGSIVGVTLEGEGLRLAAAELTSVRETLNPTKFTAVDAKDFEGFGVAMRDADVLLVATHGVPVSAFTDPNFSALGGAHSEHCISFDSVQAEAARWPCHLVILDACHSAAGGAWNLQGPFLTPDLASYPVLFLLNRRAVVIGTAWATFEKASYLLMKLLIWRLRERPVGQAFAEALATLVSMPGSEANQMLQEAGMHLEGLLPDASMEQMLQDPYCHGTFQLHGLY